MSALSGVYVAAITPRGHGHEADIGGMLELIDFLCASGVAGIALLGSTGEFLHIPQEERMRLLQLGVKRSRVPVMAGVSHSSLDGAVELAREAALAGAAGLLLMPPYFFRYEQADIKEFYLQFSSQVGASVPVFLYNIPFFTNELTFETAGELLATGRFAGIKDSSGQFGYLSRLIELRKQHDFTVMVGNDVIFTLGCRAGADGVVSGVACCVPELMLSLDRAVRDGDGEKADRLDRCLQDFIAWLDRFPAPVGVKAATAVRGPKVGACAVPLSPERQKLLREFVEWFEAWLPMVRKEATA